jgi:hypothetical protein
MFSAACVPALQLVGPRLSLAMEATAALRCLLEGSSAAQQQAAAAGATPLLVQVGVLGMYSC